MVELGRGTENGRIGSLAIGVGAVAGRGGKAGRGGVEEGDGAPVPCIVAVRLRVGDDGGCIAALSPGTSRGVSGAASEPTGTESGAMSSLIATAPLP